MKQKHFIILIIVHISIHIYGQDNRYNGIANDVGIMNPFWSNYKEDIKAQHIASIEKSISRSIKNYTLIEYCFALDQLLSKLENNVSTQNEWLLYMDSLVLYSKGNSPRAGIIPLESQFFIATLKKNAAELSRNYPKAYSFLVENTPPMFGYGYKPSDYELILKEKGFSEIKDEGVIFDLLLLEDTSLLNVIEKNPELLKRYHTWLTYNVPDRSFAFEFSEDRASEVLRRKFLYLWNLFKQQNNELAQYTAEQLLKIKVVRPKPVPQYSPLRVINGAWQGAFGSEKEIYIINSYSDVSNNDNKVTGKSKFVGQPDSKFVLMVGNYKDKGTYFEIEMIEQPDTAQWNGIFKYQINKETRILKGTWESNNRELKREFELKKRAEDEWW